MPGPAQEVSDIQVDPNAVIARLREELSGWVLRALVAEEAVATLKAKEKQASALEAKRKELMEPGTNAAPNGVPVG